MKVFIHIFDILTSSFGRVHRPMTKRVRGVSTESGSVPSASLYKLVVSQISQM